MYKYALFILSIGLMHNQMGTDGCLEVATKKMDTDLNSLTVIINQLATWLTMHETTMQVTTKHETDNGWRLYFFPRRIVEWQCENI